MLPELQGHWSIERTISGSCEAKFSGSALFSHQKPNFLNYREEGYLFLDRLSKPIYCERSYVFERTGLWSLAQHFPEGGEFLRLDFGEDLKSSGTHVCLKDTYQASYHFLNTQTLETRIAVKGPNKDYLIFSCFKKAQTHFHIDFFFDKTSYHAHKF